MRAVARARPHAPARCWQPRRRVCDAPPWLARRLRRHAASGRPPRDRGALRARRRSRRRVRRRHPRPRPDTPAPTRYALARPAPRNTRSAPRLPHERQSTPRTTRDDAAKAACRIVQRMRFVFVVQRRPAELRETEMEVARSDGRLRGSRTPALATEKTPEASLSREGSYGSIDSPGRLTRRASHDAHLTVAGQRRPLTGFPKRIPMHITRPASASQPLALPGQSVGRLGREGAVHTTGSGLGDGITPSVASFRQNLFSSSRSPPRLSGSGDGAASDDCGPWRAARMRSRV